MKTKIIDTNEQLTNIIRVGLRSKNRSVSFRLAKLLEEAGEFSEAAHTKAGILKKKIKHKEHVFEEACDSILMVIDTVACVYDKELKEGKVTENQLIQAIFKWIPKKIKKWKKVENIK